MIQRLKAHPLLWYQGPAILWAIALFAQSSVSGDDIPEFGFLEYDKVIHFLIYVVFAAVVHRAIRYQSALPSIAQHHFVATLIIVSLYGATDEWHQAFVPGRDASIEDWLADTAGGIVYLAGFWMKEKLAERKGRS